jgi:NAD-dependent deacetylase
LYVIDPAEVALPRGCDMEHVHIESGATLGLQQLKAILELE